MKQISVKAEYTAGIIALAKNHEVLKKYEFIPGVIGNDGLQDISIRVDDESMSFYIGFFVGMVTMEVVTRLKYNIGTNTWNKNS